MLELFESVDNNTLDTIRQACAGVIDPEVFRANLTPEDVADIEGGRVSVEYLRCAAESMATTTTIRKKKLLAEELSPQDQKACER